MLTIHSVSLDDSVIKLLHESALLTSDLEAGLDVAFLGASTQGLLQGCVALERCRNVVLLRSLAVAELYRGSGLGTMLLRRAEEQAKAEGFPAIYLLTVGASEFFAGRGYQAVDRKNVPEAIRMTSQFSNLCPASSILMAKNLR